MATPATPVNTVLDKGAIAPAQKEQTGSSKAVSLIDSLLTKATLPVGTTISPTLQNVGANELMGTTGLTGTAQAATPTAPTTPTIAAPGTVASVGATTATPQTAAQMTAAQVGSAIPQATAAQGTVSAPMTAAQGTIASDATVKGQLAGLQTEVETAISSGNPLPVWARGAAKATEAAMANRGMSASSMAAQALAEGIMQSAIPIAAQDAATYKDCLLYTSDAADE